MRYNNISGSRYNFGVYGGPIQTFLHDIDASNKVDEKSIHYLINNHNLTINSSTFPNLGYLAVVNSTNIIVEGLDLSNNFNGIVLAFTNNSRVIGNNITMAEFGVYLATSSNSNVVNNSITSSAVGVRLMGTCMRNNITRNDLNVSGATEPRIGFGLDGQSKYNNMTLNNVTDGSWGIKLGSDATLNRVCHNYFVNCTNSAYSNGVNVWDDGYPSGGNYWSDHRNVDGYSGSYQNETGKDGISDTAYVIDENNIDHYPLVGNNTANLVITTLTSTGEEIENVKVWVDGREVTYYSRVNVTAACGTHNVEVEIGISYQGETYRFDHWENGSTNNPRTVVVNEDKNLTAYYRLVGGCPFVYVWNGTRYVIDNNLLPNSVSSNGTEVEDYYRLEQTLVPLYEQDDLSLYSLLLKEFQQEHSYLDQAELIVIDHESDIKVAVSPSGEILTYQNPFTPTSAMDDKGASWLQELSTIDGNYYEGYSGSYVIANFGEISAQNAKLVMRADGPPRKWSIHIQVLDSTENWADVVAIIPRTYWATEIIDLSSYIPSNGEFKVRLCFTDNHKVDYIGLDTTPQAEIEVQNAQLVLAYHSKKGDVTNKLLFDDDVYAELVPEQQIVLLFAVSKPSKTQRTFIIYVKGYYITLKG